MPINLFSEMRENWTLLVMARRSRVLPQNIHNVCGNGKGEAGERERDLWRNLNESKRKQEEDDEEKERIVQNDFLRTTGIKYTFPIHNPHTFVSNERNQWFVVYDRKSSYILSYMYFYLLRFAFLLHSMFGCCGCGCEQWTNWWHNDSTQNYVMTRKNESILSQSIAVGCTNTRGGRGRGKEYTFACRWNSALPIAYSRRTHIHSVRSESDHNNIKRNEK